MKIGIYGGSFNPIHNGHIKIARFVTEYLNLDKLIVIPVGNPSHKKNELADGKIRLEMCKVAFKDDEKIEVSDIEVFSNELNYTYDTLLKIISKFKKNEYFEIIGEDSGENFRDWKKYKEILKLAKVVVLKRVGYNLEIEDENIIEVKNPFFNYSSTIVREKIKKGEDIRDLLPKEVIDIIEKNNLYKK